MCHISFESDNVFGWSPFRNLRSYHARIRKLEVMAFNLIPLLPTWLFLDVFRKSATYLRVLLPQPNKGTFPCGHSRVFLMWKNTADARNNASSNPMSMASEQCLWTTLIFYRALRMVQLQNYSHRHVVLSHLGVSCCENWAWTSICDCDERGWVDEAMVRGCTNPEEGIIGLVEKPLDVVLSVNALEVEAKDER